MKRTKEWWATLTLGERSELHWLERYALAWALRGGMDGHLPDDCSECPKCNTPHTGAGLCPACNQQLDNLINKANQAMKIKE